MCSSGIRFRIESMSCKQLLHRNNFGITSGTRAKYQYKPTLLALLRFLGCRERSAHFPIDLFHTRPEIKIVNFYVNNTCVVQKLSQVNK